MAIEINQNLDKRKQSFAPIFFLIVGILLLILSGVGYFYLQDLNVKADSTLSDIEKEIFQTKNDDFKNKEKEVLAWAQKVKDYNSLFASRGTPSNILLLLEKDIHPKVRLDSFDFLAVSANNSNNTVITGVANDFVSLQQQILILSKESTVGKINLSEVSLGKDGKINFELSIAFSKEILTPKVLK